MPASAASDPVPPTTTGLVTASVRHPPSLPVALAWRGLNVPAVMPPAPFGGNSGGTAIGALAVVGALDDWFPGLLLGPDAWLIAVPAITLPVHVLPRSPPPDAALDAALPAALAAVPMPLGGNRESDNIAPPGLSHGHCSAACVQASRLPLLLPPSLPPLVLSASRRLPLASSCLPVLPIAVPLTLTGRPPPALAPGMSAPLAVSPP